MWRRDVSAACGLVCFATSTKEFGNRNIISTIQFAAREEREKGGMSTERPQEREKGNRKDRKKKTRMTQCLPKE